MRKNPLVNAVEEILLTTEASPQREGSPPPIGQLWNSGLQKLQRPNDPSASLPADAYWLRHALSDGSLDQADLAILDRFYATLMKERNLDEVRGAIGFLLVCRLADRVQQFRSQGVPGPISNLNKAATKSFTDANRYLFDAAVRSWIAKFYQTDSIVADPNSQVQVLASGTTSYILRYSGGANFVLKLIKPYFLNNTTIRTQTRSYGENIQSASGSNTLLPKIFAVGDAYIMMEFIEGSSLADALSNESIDRLTAVERLDIIYGIIRNLESLSQPHLDLSPGNIMIETLPLTKDESARFKVRLIDFGYNYLLREGMSGVPIRSDIIRYSAPELSSDVNAGSTQSDLYSLGLIILEIMRPNSSIVDVSVQLDRCWRDYPHLATTAEDLISPEPTERLSWTHETEQTAIYTHLRLRLSQEEQLAKLTGTTVNLADALGGGRGPIRELASLAGKIPDLWRLRSTGGATVSKANYLFWWSTAVNAYLVGALAICGYTLFFQTLDLYALLPKQTTLSALSTSWHLAVGKITAIQQSPDLQAVFAGQVMALTIVLVVAQYYNGIFSPITTRYSKGDAAKWAEWTIRSTPFIIGLLCVSTTIWFPQWWFATSLIGPLVTAANNQAVLKYCVSVRNLIRQKPTFQYLDTTDMARFEESFQRWPRAMIYTGLLIFFVGILLRMQIIRDEAFFGASIAFLCYAGLLQSSSKNLSALVREGIRRFVKAGERLKIDAA